MQTNTNAYQAGRAGKLHRIPDELKGIGRWMGTRFSPRPGKPGHLDKPPYRVQAGKPVIKADKTDPANWTTFAEAHAAYERGEVHAIGLVLTEDDPYFGLDFDKVLDPETGEINEAGHNLIHAFGTYAEISCSGRGLRAIGIGTKPEYAGCKSKALGFGVEVYDKAWFLVMTGNHLAGTSEGVEERQGELEALCRQLWPKKKRPRKPTNSAAAHTIDDAELLERARRSRTRAKFTALYDRGDVSGYASASEADYALINALIFWTAGDRERIAALFEQSALYRKEKHREYVATSVDNALSSYRGSFYQPRSIKTLAPDVKEDALAPYLALLLDPAIWRGQRGASAYKLYTAAVGLATERGIDADGCLRIGVDIRTLAETAGLTKETLCRSALPYLITEMKLARTRDRKKGEARELILLSPTAPAYANKVSTHFIGVNQRAPDETLSTLRQIIRMRGGRAKKAKVARLGMVAMFVVVALCAAPRRGYSLEELATATGRRKRDHRPVLRKLKSAGIVREPREDHYRLTDSFRIEYENALIDSGITRSERIQRMRHAEEREMRDEKLRERRERVRTLEEQGMRRDIAEREVCGKRERGT